MAGGLAEWLRDRAPTVWAACAAWDHYTHPPPHETSDVVRLAWTVDEVAEALGVSRAWVYQRVRSGEIPTVHVGGPGRGRRLILPERVEQLLRDRESGQEEEDT